tara:strand:- start:860 stop:1060 length:201 start_codon:yes stop_codon:yes gene_type:complete
MHISKSELIHHKIQAALRENLFMEDDLMYLGFNEEKGEHEYKINGQHIVLASQIEDFELVESEDDT